MIVYKKGDKFKVLDKSVIKYGDTYIDGNIYTVDVICSYGGICPKQESVEELEIITKDEFGAIELVEDYKDYKEHKGDNRRGDLDIEELKTLITKSTSVVNWYPHTYESQEGFDATVRGPFGRWFKVTERQGDDPVASAGDDAKYAAAAMNYLPHLVEEVEKLRAEVERFRVNESRLRLEVERLTNYSGEE